ncbi:uncharacterized protein TNIN_68901 [Trichonephila inaurata madagascariensis]|uniref:Uncharacterized protein n=1 Tax=Trichonephila inaurata madagascariensis TaxID=2747483 RepID=A0A8X6YLU6_9ARAC|nr:uncharacterized protein TNIN_68901 [Trichonephila inaurata madagascariensis]
MLIFYGVYKIFYKFLLSIVTKNYYKSTTTKDYQKKAVLEVKNGSAILYATSKRCSVPEETVGRWVVKSPSYQGPECEFKDKAKKRAQSKTGKVLTKENVLERLAAEESGRKNKFNQVNIKKDVKDSKSFKEVKQGSWIEVEYRSRSQSSKFIGQVIDINV